MLIGLGEECPKRLHFIGTRCPQRQRLQEPKRRKGMQTDLDLLLLVGERGRRCVVHLVCSWARDPKTFKDTQCSHRAEVLTSGKSQQA